MIINGSFVPTVTHFVKGMHAKSDTGLLCRSKDCKWFIWCASELRWLTVFDNGLETYEENLKLGKILPIEQLEGYEPAS